MVKNRKKKFILQITNSIHTVLALLTRNREYFMITAPEEIVSGPLSGRVQYEFCSAQLETEGKRQFLYIGKDVVSRDETRPENYESYDELVRLKERGAEVTYFSISELYRVSRGKTLRITIQAKTERGAVGMFTYKLLRIGVNPGQWYIGRSFLKMSVLLSDVDMIQNCEEEIRTVEEELAMSKRPTRLSDYEVYDEILNRLRTNNLGYGDDLIIEYELLNGNEPVYYFLMESYYNHNWNMDPAGILVVRLCAELSDPHCMFDSVRYSHPTKYTRNIVSGNPALLREIRLDCSEAEGIGYIQRINQDQIFDNLSDLSAWLYFYHYDIHLA